MDVFRPNKDKHGKQIVQKKNDALKMSKITSFDICSTMSHIAFGGKYKNIGVIAPTLNSSLGIIEPQPLSQGNGLFGLWSHSSK